MTSIDMRSPTSGTKRNGAVDDAGSPCGVHLDEVGFLDRFATIDADAGQHVENRVITALGAIKADILRFGLNDRVRLRPPSKCTPAAGASRRPVCLIS